MTDDDKLLHSHELDGGAERVVDGGEEAEFEATPRQSKWGGVAEKQDLHYLLPLKGKHGRLIQQEPTLVPGTAAGETGLRMEREGGREGGRERERERERA